MPFDTIHPVDSRYFDDLAAMVDYEHEGAIDPEVAGRLAQIGIKQGQLRPRRADACHPRRGGPVASVRRSAWATPPGTSTGCSRTGSGSARPGIPAFRDPRGRPKVDKMVELAWFATGRTGR